MNKYIIQTGIVIGIIGGVFALQASADVKLISDQDLKNITGQSGFTVSPFPGFEVEIEDDDEEKPCENPDDCDEEKEEKEGGSFSFQLPQSGVLPLGMVQPGYMMMDFTGSIRVGLQTPVLNTIKIVNTIPLDIVTAVPMSIGGGFF